MTTPTTPPEPNNGAYSAALAAAYSAAVARVRRTTFSFVERAWNLSGSWRDADADRFVRVVTPVVEAAERSISTLTTSYLNRTASEVTGHQTPTVTVPSSEVTGSALRGGVDPEVVYRRPYRQVWTDLAAGTPLEKAVEAGERRAVGLAATDMQLAKTHTAHHHAVKDERVVGYRRVPQGTYTCALCLITSTVRYRKQDMLPIHEKCDCTIEEIFGHFDPGPVLDEKLLEAVHDAIARDLGEAYVARSGRREDTAKRLFNYRDIVVVHEHGEIGPVLGVRGHKFTGPEDIPKGVRKLTHDKIRL